MYFFNNKYTEILNKCFKEGKFFLHFIFSEIPVSGWKIHVSCVKSNYNIILDIVSEYCYENQISFKVIKDIELYFKNGLKNGERSSYGKFITIYPNDNDKFTKSIEELYLLLKDYVGPYILSDKRYKDCKCLYYRYGNNLLTGQYDKEGNAIRLIKYNNIEYVDISTGYYNVPEFINTPFNEIDNTESISTRLLLNYDICDGIKFSPIGGVYKAIKKKTQEECIVKEFYPHTGIINDNIDSFNLFINEVENLKKMNIFPFVPKYIESFQDWDNFYLVEEYIEGDNLEIFVAKNNPVVFEKNTKKTKKYILQILRIFLRIVDNIIVLYQNGYFLTDLSPDNIIINDEQIYFIDLESVYEINCKKDYYNYTFNFYNLNNSVEDNIKLLISNLLLFCFNKKTELFHIFNPEQILNPIIRRNVEVSEILNLINQIYDEYTDILKINDLIRCTLQKIDESNDKNKIIISPKSIQIKGYVFDEMQNKNSLAYGTLGQYLAHNYIFGEIFNIEVFQKYIADYRGNSFFYGHAGLLYILNLNTIKCDKVLTKIISNIDYSDFSLKTGIAGVGISLLYDFLKNNDAKVIKIIEKIEKNLKKFEFLELDNSLENGKLGIALFHIYHYHIFRTPDSIEYAKKFLNLVIKDLKSGKYKKSLASNLKYRHYEYYISNGLCGLIIVLIEFFKKTKLNIFEDEIKYFLNLCFDVYSISSSFFSGNAGFLFTCFYATINLELDITLKNNLENQMKQFYLDIVNTYYNEDFYDITLKNGENYFLGGKEGILTILNIVDKKLDNQNIFPFIL